MNAVMRKTMKRVLQGAVAAVVLVGAFEVNAAECTSNTVALMGQMEVVAPSLRVADAQTRGRGVATKVFDLGSMTVTARRETALAERAGSESAGESTETRTRSPRAVLVQ